METAVGAHSSIPTCGSVPSDHDFPVVGNWCQDSGVRDYFRKEVRFTSQVSVSEPDPDGWSPCCCRRVSHRFGKSAEQK